jgi:hypothetical protein
MDYRSKVSITPELSRPAKALGKSTGLIRVGWSDLLSVILLFVI